MRLSTIKLPGFKSFVDPRTPHPPTNTTGVVGPSPGTTGPAAGGTYEYVNAGLRVVVQIDGTEGTMEVDNGTDRELDPPGFYILDARDGTEIDGEKADDQSRGQDRRQCDAREQKIFLAIFERCPFWFGYD